MSSLKTIVVAGDFVLDHHIYEGRRQHYGDGISLGVKFKPQLGGAALVHLLLEKMLRPHNGQPPRWQSQPAVKLPQLQSSVTLPGSQPDAKQPESLDDVSCVPSSQRAYAFWRPFPADAAREKQYWRVSEAMGFGTADKDETSTWPQNSLPEKADVIVLADGGMGFRQDEAQWRDLKFGDAAWIILKTVGPFEENKLLRELSKNHAKKLIVVVSAPELRKSTARISAGLSWEETVESLLNELRPSGALGMLTQCRHLIVAAESEGGLWIDLEKRPKNDAALDDCRVHMVYAPASIEGEHAHAVKGTAFGFLSCLTAAVAWQITTDDDSKQPDFASAIEGGLAAMRDLLERGHGPARDAADGFPAARLADAVKYPAHLYSRAVFPFSASKRASTKKNGGGPVVGWSLLAQLQREQKPAYELGRLVVLRGPIALSNLPQLRIGNLLTVDRSEIESLRTLTQVVRRYESNKKSKKPLSVGVFGPPGSGKSFAVEEMALKWFGKDAWMEFNLSQFNGPEDLIGAFHQIRDRVLRGILPVAFFDEFDSQSYRWLQYLLAPMQDGKFQEGQLTHALGKCIFVFAGGTSRTFEAFGDPRLSEGAEHPSEELVAEAKTAFRLAKGPDFKSRLDAYLNVVGPNRRQIPAPPTTRRSRGNPGPFVVDPTDIFFPIRRALMIRSGLRLSEDAKLSLDEGVLNALLKVSVYTHGSRSLNKLLEPLAAALPGTLHRSLLAPAGQIAMHADAAEFLRLCGDVRAREAVERLPAEEVDLLAPVIHETWRELGRKRGWPKKKETDRDFQDLDPHYKESNREAARRMPDVLNLVGLQLTSGRADDDQRQTVRDYLEYHLELLAEAEHEGWMLWHLNRGWCYSAKRNDDQKLHHCLLPYAQLQDSDRNKDRDSIRHFPEFADRAGKKIVFR